MTQITDIDSDFIFSGNETTREREDNRSLAKLVSAWTAGCVLALSIALAGGYRVIVSDPATARHFDGIAPMIQAFLPEGLMGDRERALASEEDPRLLGEIAPAAGPDTAIGD